jgi:hypothetical protein
MASEFFVPFNYLIIIFQHLPEQQAFYTKSYSAVIQLKIITNNENQDHYYFKSKKVYLHMRFQSAILLAYLVLGKDV